MFSETLLCSGWTLEADILPDRLCRDEAPVGFSLPGAAALEAFSDLLGASPAQEESPPSRPHAPLSLPAMLPADVIGSAALSREIDFGRLCGERAVLEIDHLCGSGCIELDGHALHAFGEGIPCALVDLTDALRAGRRQTLVIRFDNANGAGVPCAVRLRTTGWAHFETVTLTADRARSTLSADIRLHTNRPGTYIVRAACVRPGENSGFPWRESRLTLAKEGRLNVSFSLPECAFEAGAPYDAPVLKLALYAASPNANRACALLDSRTMITGFSGPAPKAYLPLTPQECRMAPDALIGRAKDLGVSALFLPIPCSPLMYRSCLQAGIALVQYAPSGTALAQYITDCPCVTLCRNPDPQAFSAPSAAAGCWQLCGMPALPSLPDGSAFDHELLLDATGKLIDADSADTSATLISLRALQLRLRAEAARQGQYSGAICAPGEWRSDSVAAALRSAFAPLHLSALPLRGAWWAHSFFSASLAAFIPEQEQTGAYAVHAELLDSDGQNYAAFSRDCPLCGGVVGVIEGRLPAEACVLTLHIRLLRSGAVILSEQIPVYVGERGPLEAAF